MKTPLHSLQPALEQYAIDASEANEVSEGFNHHFRITTADGEKHLIIFRPQPGKPPRELQFQMRQHIEGRGFGLAPRPVPTLSGKPYAKTQLGTVALAEWIPGRAGSSVADWTPELVSEAGTVLAGLHQAIRDFRPDRSGSERLAALYLPADVWVDRAPELLDEFRSRTGAAEPVSAEVTERLEATRERFDHAAYNRSLSEGPTVVHGDFRPANLVVDEGRIAAVVDFDAVFWDSRLYDLAFAAYQFGGDECVYPQRSWEPAIDFVASYVRRWPLSDDERALFPFFLRQVVMKRVLIGHEVVPRLRLLDQLDAGLEDDLVAAAA